MARFLRRQPAPQRTLQDATRRANLLDSTLYWVIGPDSGWSNPTANEVRNGQLSGGGTATAAGYEASPTSTTDPFTFAEDATGLTAATDYRVAYVWHSGTNDSTVVVSGVLTTASGSTFFRSRTVYGGRAGSRAAL